VVACLSQIYVDRKRKTLALYMYLLRKIPLDKEMEYIYINLGFSCVYS